MALHGSPNNMTWRECLWWLHKVNAYLPSPVYRTLPASPKKNQQKKPPTHLILVLLCKCPPKNVPSNTLLSGFFFPRLLQISLPLCAQQRSENPLWQQGEKRQEKKKEKRKRFDNMAHFPWEKKFLLNSHTAPFFSLSSHFVNSFAATWTFLATLGRVLVA